MDTTDQTAPAPETVFETNAPTQEVETTEEPNLTETPEEGDEQESQEEFIDIEQNGKTYKVPKSLESLLMFQKDYTQKTQTLAEQRRDLEATRQATEWEAGTKAALFKEEAQAFALDQRLEQFANVNWPALAQQDMQRYASLQAEYTQLRDARSKIGEAIDGRRAELIENRERQTATALHKAMEHLNKPKPDMGWDGKFDTAKRESLTKFGLQLGFTDEELSNTSHPLMVQTLNLARIGYESLKAKSASLSRPQEAKPVTVVASGKTRTGPANPDKLPMKEWLKWRDKQIERKSS